MTPREAFETLGLPNTATPLEAKAAWRALARALHSDFHQDKEPEQREVLENSLRRVNAAWEFLQSFYELPAAQRSRQLGLGVVEAERPERSHAPPAQQPFFDVRVRRAKKVRKTPWWVIVPAALIPLGIAGYFLSQQLNTHSDPVAHTPMSATPPTGPVGETGDPNQWIGRQVVVAACAGKSACNDPDCSAGPLLKSLREFYGFKDAYVVYGVPDSQKTGLLFNEVLTSLRPDRFSVRPIVIATDSLSNANSRIERRRNPANACRFTFNGPFTMTGYGGPIPSETKAVAGDEELTLQLDELQQRASDDDTLIAEFTDPESDRKYHFEYGGRRETIEGPMVANAPQDNSDVGSLYRVKFHRVEYARDSVLFAANHEFVSLTRVTGERESKQYRGVPLMANPRKAIRKLERVDLAGIRRCQVMVNDPAGYSACALRLIQQLEAAGRLKAIDSQELRYRVRNLSID